MGGMWGGSECGGQDAKMLIGRCQPHLQALFGRVTRSSEAPAEPLSDFSISARPSGTARHYCMLPLPTSHMATRSLQRSGAGQVILLQLAEEMV